MRMDEFFLHLHTLFLHLYKKINSQNIHVEMTKMTLRYHNDNRMTPIRFTFEKKNLNRMWFHPIVILFANDNQMHPHPIYILEKM